MDPGFQAPTPRPITTTISTLYEMVGAQQQRVFGLYFSKINLTSGRRRHGKRIDRHIKETGHSKKSCYLEQKKRHILVCGHVVFVVRENDGSKKGFTAINRNFLEA